MQMHVPVFLILLQSLFSCQQSPENAQAVAANVGFYNSASAQKSPCGQFASTTGVILQSDDSGQTWQDISAGLPEGLRVSDLHVGDDGQILLGSGEGLFRSSPPPASDAWQSDFNLGRQADGIFPGKGGVYVSKYDKGFFQNLPGTDIWKAMDIALEDKTVRRVLELPDGTVFVTTDSGIFKSTDGCKTWKHVFSDHTVSEIIPLGNELYSVVINGVLRSTDGGEHWEYAKKDNGLYKMQCVLDGKLAVFTRTQGQKVMRFSEANSAPENNCKKPKDIWEADFYGGTDDGKWQDLVKGLAEFKDFSTLHQVGDYLFCNDKSGLLRSSDRGKTWQLVRAAPEGDEETYRLYVSGKSVFIVKSFGC